MEVELINIKICEFQKNCRDFYLFVFTDLEKYPERERVFQRSVVFNLIFLGLHAIVFYFSNSLDKFQNVTGTEGKTIVIAMSSPNTFMISSFNPHCF